MKIRYSDKIRNTIKRTTLKEERLPIWQQKKSWVALIGANLVVVLAGLFHVDPLSITGVADLAEAKNAQQYTQKSPNSVGNIDETLVAEESITSTQKKAIQVSPALANTGFASAILESTSSVATLSSQELSEISRLSNVISKKFRIAPEAAEFMTHYTFERSKIYKVDPVLMLAVIGIESRFNPLAHSVAGAVGLTQMLPRAHPDKVKQIESADGHILNITDNIDGGMKILAEYMRWHNNSKVLALQQYNGSLNDPTRKYSKKVLALFEEMKSYKLVASK